MMRKGRADGTALVGMIRAPDGAAEARDRLKSDS